MKRILLALTLPLLAAALPGCLTPASSKLPDQFLLHGPADVQPVEKIPVTLGFRELDAARPFQLMMAYADADGRLNFYQTATWAEFPAAALTRLLRETVVNSGRFADAGMADRMARPDWMLIGYLDAFNEDRATTPAHAVVQVRLELRRARETDLLWSATLRESEPVSGEGPGALAAAMDKAVARLVQKAVARIVAVPYLPSAAVEALGVKP